MSYYLLFFTDRRCYMFLSSFFSLRIPRIVSFYIAADAIAKWSSFDSINSIALCRGDRFREIKVSEIRRRS